MGAIIIVAIAVLGAALVALSMRSNPVLSRISLRNIGRRKGSTALVILGSMVGTALITGSLVISDTSGRTNQNAAYLHLGEIDEVVSLPGSQGTDGLYFDRQLMAGLVNVEKLNARTAASQNGDLVDGAIVVIQEQAPVRKVDSRTGQSILMEPRVNIVALDRDELADFGRRPPLITRPAKGEVIASPGLARELEIEPGDTIEVLRGGTPHSFRVREVEDLRGTSGLWSMTLAWLGVPPVMLMGLEDGQAVFADGVDQANAIFVSNSGGVTDSYQHTAAVQQSLGALLQDADVRGDFQVLAVKSEILDQDFSIGDMFLTFSMFVIVAGIMLVLNIYAMLAEERRTEMGVMRAMGMRREHLVRLYLYEGLVYSLGVALVGVVVGLGLARLVVWGMNELAVTATASTGDEMVFTARPISLLVAGAAGTAVTLGTVLYTSIRISGINIVAAMRDLPEYSTRTRRRWTVVWPVLLGLAGLLLTAQAVSADDGILYVLGPTFAAIGMALTLQRFLPARPLLSAIYLGLIAYSQLAILIPAVEEADESGMATFLTGMVLVLSAIGLVVLNFQVIVWLVRQTVGRLRPILPIVRIAIAYPAERPTRTGFTLGMFSLVIFFATVAGIFLHMFTGAADDIRQGQVGGFDAIVTVNPINPVHDLEKRLRESPTQDFGSITDVSTMRTARVELPEYRQADYQSSGEAYATSADAPLSEEITGLDAVFLRTTNSEFSLRAPEYASDREIWEALAQDPALAVVADPYSGGHWRLRRPVVEPGDVLRLRDPWSGQVYEKKVVGRLVSSAVEGFDSMGGILVSQEALEREFASQGERPTGPYLLRISDEVDRKAVANSVEKELIANGAQVYLVSELVELSMAWLSIIRILQAFLAFGLVVGIAGLAVVAARAVYQRRQDIGTLRALGFRRGMVLAYLLVESSVVSLLGILLGVAAGTLAGYGMYLRYVKDDVGGAFSLPVAEMAALVFFVYLAGLAFTFLPALAAAALPPAEALRPKE